MHVRTTNISSNSKRPHRGIINFSDILAFFILMRATAWCSLPISIWILQWLGLVAAVVRCNVRSVRTDVNLTCFYFEKINKFTLRLVFGHVQMPQGHSTICCGICISKNSIVSCVCWRCEYYVSENCVKRQITWFRHLPKMFPMVCVGSLSLSSLALNAKPFEAIKLQNANIIENLQNSNELWATHRNMRFPSRRCCLW